MPKAWTAARALRRALASPRFVLGPGAPTADVMELQRALRSTWAPGLDVDGQYGDATRRAVALAQKRMGAPVTGFADASFVQSLRAQVRLAILERRVVRLQEKVDALAWGEDVIAPPWPRGASLRSSEIQFPAVGGRREATLRIEAPSTSFVAREVAEHGLAEYEPATMATFLALVEMTRGAVLDVGANIGVFALVASVWFDDRPIVAFEPTPDLAAVCRYLASLNGRKIEVREVALGPENTTATFYLSDSTDASSSLREGFRVSRGTLEVQVERLDDAVAGVRPPPSVVKIDTESTEPDVLRGARRIIASERPWIVCEVLAGRTEPELEAFLADHGYEAYHLTDIGPVAPTRPVVGDPTYQDMNWMFAPDPVDDEFWRLQQAWFDVLRASRTLSY